MTTNPKCTLCWLHRSANVVCMPCKPNQQAPLQVFIDSPSPQDDEFGEFGSSRVSRLLFWMFEKWTLAPEEVGVNFAVRCCGSDLKKIVDKKDALAACSIYSERYITCAKALLGFGELSSMRLLANRSLKNTVYQEHKREHPVSVFISYAPGYFLQKPSEVVAGLRMLYRAARAAGLKPELNTELELFDFGTI